MNIGRRKLMVGSFAAAVTVGLALFLFKTSFAESSSWLSDAAPTLHQEAELPPNTFQPFSIDGNRDCTDRTFVTRPAGVFPFPPFIQSQQSFIACAVDTVLGAIEPNGYLAMSNTSVAGKTIKYQYTDSNIIPIPNSVTTIHYTSAPISGLYLFFTKNSAAYITPTIKNTLEVTYNFNQPDDLALRDKANNLLPVQIESMSFSENGKWMIVDSANRAMLRINLETFEVMPFASAFNYNLGIGPHAQTTISNDGRFVAVASTSFASFKIYDLHTCTGIPTGAINGPANCKSRDLWDLIQQKISNFKSLTTLRFINNYMISMYVNAPHGASTNIFQYTLTAAGHGVQKLDYLALGDSFASGEGANAYQDGTDTHINKCHLSLASYPYLLEDDLALDNSQSVACSGAKINDITDGSGNYNGQAKDKRARKDRSSTEIEDIITSYKPGYINQLDFVKTYSPKIITISAVGNDIGYGNILKRCIEPDTCYSTYEDRLELVRQINNKFNNLTRMYQKIKNSAVATTKVYVVGYPQLAHPGGNCAANVHLDASELLFSQQLINYLNTVIKQAASKVGVAYIDVETSLSGHKLCETKSSNVAVNGLSAGNDVPRELSGPFGSESYHPNKLGQELMEQSILSKTLNFTLPMPTSNSSAGPPAESGLAILNAARSNRAINAVNYDDDLSNDVIYRQSPWDITIKLGQSPLKIFASYSVLLGSTNLGTFTTSANGELNVRIQLPITAKTGLNTVHVTGQSLSGEPIDISKSVVVGGNTDDTDGDDVPNNTDPCAVVNPSGQDIDIDGIDDSCDGFIDDNPLPSSLYRARNGIANRGERVNFIYTERNVKLARRVFGLNDYDPDGDGWALVAKSAGSGTAGVIARFWVNETGNASTNTLDRYVPRISIRKGRGGCVQMTPKSLSAVLPKAQKRRYGIEKDNASTCRGSETDSDHDGIPDATQSLYRVRYGRLASGENPHRIFIERNTHAAEAQLGISDYSKNHDGWAIVGASKGPVKQRVRGMALVDPNTKIVLASYRLGADSNSVNDLLVGLSDTQRRTAQPVALIERSNNMCRAITPNRLGVVVKGTQRRVKGVRALQNTPCP